VLVLHPDRLGLQPIRLGEGPGRYFAHGPARSPSGTQIVLRLFLPAPFLTEYAQTGQTCILADRRKP
jgi:hypothetical protein